jgi:hypothetical protein
VAPQAISNDARAKAKAQEEYNRRMNAKDPIVYVGSQVLFKLKKHKKDTSAWDSEPYTVTAVKGSMITATRHDKTVTRNSSSFKLFRQVDFNLPEPPNSGQNSSERRGEAPLEERVTQTSQAAVEDATTTYSSMDAPGSGPPSAIPETIPSSKGKGGRHSKADTERIQRERQEAQAAKDAANPHLRRSSRLNKQPQRPHS